MSISQCLGNENEFQRTQTSILCLSTRVICILSKLPPWENIERLQVERIPLQAAERAFLLNNILRLNVSKYEISATRSGLPQKGYDKVRRN